jgi:predicted Zn-dependent protease
MKSIFLKAALGAAFLLPVPAFSQSKAETYKDIIEKAYNLSLQKDRQQALNILSAAIARESRPNAQAELKKAALDVAHVFFSDKAQQLYETTLSLKKTELNQAISKLAEAQRIEPDNQTIVTEMARLQIAKNDCSSAQENLLKPLKLIPFDDELRLTNAQAQACNGQWLEFAKSPESMDAKKSQYQKYWMALSAEHQLKLKNLTKASETVQNLAKLDPKYPEAYYWGWKVSQALKKNNVEQAQKYVMTCKNISASQYRQYMIDPMLCRRTAEVEGETKGMNGNSE